MKTKCIAYCRTSTDNQKEEKTIELQVEKLTEYAEQNNIEIVRWFKDDGVSGGLEERPALMSLMKFLETNMDVEAVLIYKLDRLARDLYIQEGLIQEFTKLKRRVISSMESNLEGNDPFRKAFRQMLGIFSEFEKSMITLRMKNGRASSVAKGNWHGGSIYGYDHGKNGELIINKAESEVIKRIWHLKRYKQMNASQISKILNEEKVPTKRKDTKWYPLTVRKILRNPIYRGVIRYKGKTYEGNHEPILK